MLAENADWYFEQLKGLPPSQRVLARALAAEPVREFPAGYRERQRGKSPIGLFDHEYITPEIVKPPQEAFYAKKRRVLMCESTGLVAGEFVMSYPPGIPIVAPGERITPDVLEHILFAKEKGCFMTGTEDMNLEYINVLA